MDHNKKFMMQVKKVLQKFYTAIQDGDNCIMFRLVYIFIKKMFFFCITYWYIPSRTASVIIKCKNYLNKHRKLLTGL